MKEVFYGALALLFLAGPALAQQPPTPVYGHSGTTFGFAASGDQDNSTDVSIKAATTGIRHCVTSIQISAIDSIAADENFRMLSADTVIWSYQLNATQTNIIAATFPIPICTVAGEALEVDTAGDPADNLIFYNIQGYSAP